MIIKEKRIDISIDQPKKIADIFQDIFKTYDEIEIEKERVYTIGLDNQNHIMFIDLTHIGMINQSVVDRRVILRMLLLKGCTGVILVHNHPAEYNTPMPSAEDINVTKSIKEACKLMDIELLDHIILNRDATNFYSFKADNLI